MILGISGNIASGKSTFAKEILESGMFCGNDLSNAVIIEVDELGHQLLLETKTKHKLMENFGSAIFDADGEIDRETLGQVVFSNGSTLDALESVLHPLMRKELQRRIKSSQDVIIVCALPRAFDLESICDTVVDISISKGVSWERVQRRSPHITEEMFELIWTRQ